MPQRYPRSEGRPSHSYHFDNNRHDPCQDRPGGLRCCLCSKSARRRPAVNRSTQKNGSTGQALRISIGGTLKIRRFTAAAAMLAAGSLVLRSEEHTSELQSRGHLVCRLLLEKKK